MIRERITAIKDVLKDAGIDFYIVPTSDYHNSEYVNDYFKVREYFSNFTGSNGTLLVWQEGAGLWTDGRYFIQAEKELVGSEVCLYKSGNAGVPGPVRHLLEPVPGRSGGRRRHCTDPELFRFGGHPAGGKLDRYCLL